MTSIGNTRKLFFTGFFFHISFYLAAQNPCAIPSLIAETVGDEQSCNPIDFGYILSGYENNDPNTEYIVNYGDGTTETILHTDLDPSGTTTLRHTYSQVSCATDDKFYTFSVIAGANCTAFPREVTIAPIITGRPPTPNFTFDQAEACVNERITFENTSLEGFNFECETDAEYVWNFGDNSMPLTIPAKVDVQHEFTAEGTYTVSLTINQECGTRIFTEDIVIGGPPAPEFEIGNPGNIQTISDCTNESFVPDPACVPLTVPIRSLSANTGLTETWSIVPAQGASFANGTTTSNNPNETISFTEGGVYRLTLTSQSNCGEEASCVDIIVSDDPALDGIQINGLEANTCSPATIDMSLTTEITNIGNYQWQVTGVGGTPNPPQPAGNTTADPDPFNLPPGTYEVALTVTNACATETFTEQIEVVDFDDPVITPDVAEFCADEIIPLSTQELPGATYQWFLNGDTLANATGRTLVPTADGQYSVAVSLGICVKTSVEKRVAVFDVPEVDFNVPPSVCQEVDFTPEILTPDTLNHTFRWEIDGEFFSDELSPTFNFEDISTAVEITFRVTSDEGCANELSKTISVQGETVVGPSFSLNLPPGDNCAPLEVGFTNDNTDPNITYQWDFGNGNTSNEVTPPNQIFDAGVLGDTVYYVTLEAPTACGVFTFTDSILVKAPVNADFSLPADTVSSNITATITNLSTGTATSYEWDFGDGTTMTVDDTAAVTHNFIYFGEQDTTFTVTLTAFNECNTSTISKQVTVVPNVFFEVRPQSGCAPLTVEFSTNLTEANETAWIWGDESGNIVTGGANQTYTYESAGTFEASLILFYTSGASDTFRTEITVLPFLEASFEVESDQNAFCPGAVISFNNTSPDPIGSFWDFGDNTFFTGTNPPDKEYDNPGTYEVSLTVVNPFNNCPNTVTKTVEIIPFVAPDFAASKDTICVGEEITLNNLTEDAASYQWTFDDGKNTFSSIEESPEWIFDTPGLNTITLQAFSEPNLQGCTETIQRIINVESGADVAFSITLDVDCGVWLVSVENESTFPTDPSNGTLIWDFGNGNTYEGFEDIPVQEFVFNAEEQASYSVSLTGITKIGCTQTLTLPFEIEDCCMPMVYLPENDKTLAFTPFNGGQNELFLLKNEFIDEYDLRVYDKWDRLVFQTNDPDEGWDGYFAGSPSPAGVYKGTVSYGGCNSSGEKTEPEARAFLLYLID